MANNLERQLALISLLSKKPHGLTRVQIGRALPGLYPAKTTTDRDSSRKKLQSDAEYLSAIGMPILCVTGPNGDAHFQMAPGAEPLPESFALDADEAAGLRKILQDPVLVQQLDEPSRRALANLLAFHAPFDMDAVGEDLEHSQDEARLARLLAMARSETTAQINYPGKLGVVETRCISPIGGWLYHGNSYVVGICHRDMTPKTFAVARISRLEAANELFQTAPKTFDLRAHANRNEFRLEKDIGLRKVEIKVSAEEAWRLKESKPEAITKEWPDGAVLG